MSRESSSHTFYVTTPIYYVNARPHLGSLYSTVLADVAKRWNMVQGKDTFFLTGTDEHGQKVADAAREAGQEPQPFVDDLVGTFKQLWRQYGIQYNHFIRTTDEYHVTAVRDWIRRLQAQGDIYKSSYEGWYCVSSEAFLTDKDLVYKEGEDTPYSALSDKPASWVSEECYFFRLSAYQERLLAFFDEHPDFITPKERLNEVRSFVEGGLKDLCISRKTLSWGIPFPGDQDHVTYVWADALNNYITGIGYGDGEKQDMFHRWWPADLQILGKDIVRFHAVYWPAFLMASGLSLPKKLLVHGWLQVGGQKMSKSLGNVVDPFKLCQTYGADPVRYYLTRYMAITQDSSFTLEDMEHKITTDLAHDCGNLVRRTVQLAHKHGYEHLAPPHVWSAASQELQEQVRQACHACRHDMHQYYYNRAYTHVWKCIHAVNSYFHAQEPWKTAKTSPHACQETLSATAHCLYAIATLVWPVMPHKMEELWGILGCASPVRVGYDALDALCGTWNMSFTLHAHDPLFVKYDTAENRSGVEQQAGFSSADAAANGKESSLQQESDGGGDQITFEHFTAVELRVGHVRSVSPLPKTDRIYVCTVSFGELGERTICAGLRTYFAPEQLEGLSVVCVYNLAPRKLKGVASHGMMLTTADADGVPQPVTVDASIPYGTRLS